MHPSKKAFTLIELLVVIAIIALLVSILLPSLNRAKGLAKKTVCLAQIKGIGLCAMMYADDNNDSLPMARADYEDTYSHHWYQLLSKYAGEDVRSYEHADLFKGCPEFDIDAADDWNTGYGTVIMIQSFPDSIAPTSDSSNYQNWHEPGTTIGGVEFRFFKRSEFSDSTRRGWMGDSPGWHIGGGPNTEYVEGEKWPTWCLSRDYGGYGLGNDPERHTDSSNIWFIDGHAKDYKYDVGGNAFYDIEKLPW